MALGAYPMYAQQRFVDLTASWNAISSPDLSASRTFISQQFLTHILGDSAICDFVFSANLARMPDFRCVANLRWYHHIRCTRIAKRVMRSHPPSLMALSCGFRSRRTFADPMHAGARKDAPAMPSGKSALGPTRTRIVGCTSSGGCA